jgi:hypothetical protein
MMAASSKSTFCPQAGARCAIRPRESAAGSGVSSSADRPSRTRLGSAPSLNPHPREGVELSHVLHRPAFFKLQVMAYSIN